ncbi:MAG: S1 RNA-binding domain-containing protein [Phascolarctobacterium sp.]|nr:S1 RNA-binding domain-containing protein [Phascolarctobacterium sp.]
MSLEVGAVVEGEVTGITNFGAFVQLPEGKVGLIHISEVSNVYVKDVHDFLKEHEKIKVKIISIDARGKIALSVKQLMPPAELPKKPQYPQSESQERGGSVYQSAPKPMMPLSFEDKLSKFLKDSDDRMLDLKRNTESKRGGRGARRER